VHSFVRQQVTVSGTACRTNRIGGVLLALLLLAVAVPAPRATAAPDRAAEVDPLIGTVAPGFVNPGPVLPHGMVGLGPDTEGPLNYGGYLFHNSSITGFSHVHMSAGVPRGGQIPVLPVTGPVREPIASPFSHADEEAEAGYYRVRLLRYGIDVELTATERAGMHRWSFPPGLPAAAVFDIGRDLTGTQEAEVRREGDVLLGHVRSSDMDHRVFFAARFDRPFTATIDGGRAVVSFGDGPGVVHAKVGISYVDEAGALGNVDAEIPGWDFDAVRAAARDAWNEALGRIEITGGTALDRTRFSTALYHAQLFPNLLSDVDGRYPGLDDRIHTAPRDEPQYTGFSLWDSYRGQNQLLAVIDPDAYADMVTSLLRDHEQGGELPRWVFANRAPNHMSGDPVVPFIAEAWCRGLVPPPQRRPLYDAMRSLVDKRPPTYLAHGYAPVPKPANPLEVLEGGPREAGTTLEWGVAEHALALMAPSVAEQRELVQRSQGWRALLDPQTRWIRPRHDDGSWLDSFLPENGYGFQEGTSWQYSWLVMQDVAGLVDAMGGAGVVRQRLDTFFALPARVQNQLTVFGIEYRGNQYAPGNEHDLQAPFLYSWVGAPWRTQEEAREALTAFTPTPDGLPGNDDLGALSGWLVWTMLGVYPITPGAPIYTVASPVFERAVVHRPGRSDLVIEAPGASPAAPYVAASSLERPWFGEDVDHVRLEMSPLPNRSLWADAALAPPSQSTHDLEAFACAP
jgi:predicted alpha-1,2-mannosidase